MTPASGASNPLIKFRTVVLPDPFGPMSAVTLPVWIDKSSPSTARTPLNAFRNPTILSEYVDIIET
jgi:hypothetical protein